MLKCQKQIPKMWFNITSNNLLKCVLHKLNFLYFILLGMYISIYFLLLNFYIIVKNKSFCGKVITVYFRYKHLSECGQNTNQEDESGKRAMEAWSANIGEPVIDIKAIQINSKEYIAVLGERNLIFLKDGGKTLFMKRLECSPMCFTTYSLGNSANIFMVQKLVENISICILKRSKIF